MGYRIRGDRLYHERILVGHVADQKWIIVTPDFDLYMEDLSDDRTFRDVKHRPRHGVAPDGLPGNAEFYVFDPAPSAQRIRRWMQEAEAMVDAERGLLGLPEADPDDLPALAPELL